MLRARLKLQRQAMTDDTARALSSRITKRAHACIDWSTVQTLHVYSPLTKYHEVDPAKLLEHLQHTHPDIAIASWRKTGISYQAHWLQTGQAVPAGQQFDAIIVPLLGFNHANQRIGFGGGFYDRFLAAQPQAITIGLCYESGHVQFRAEPHDIPLRYIVTEQTTYENAAQ